MYGMMQRLNETVERLLSEKTPRALLDRMQKELREVHVDRFALLRFAHSGEPLGKWMMGFRASPKWIEVYKHRDDPSADPIIKRCRETVEPFFWHEAADADRIKRAEALQLLEALIIPVPGPHGIVGAEWMGGPSREKLHKYRVIIQAIGFACYYHLQRLLDKESDPPTAIKRLLSDRERDILYLVADGMSSNEAAKHLNLSPRTVEWHVHKAMNKLRAKNRIQAVVLALRDGLID